MKKPRFKGLLPDFLILLGIGLIGGGLYLWRLDVALCVVGVIVLVLGVLMVANAPPREANPRDI